MNTDGNVNNEGSLASPSYGDMITTYNYGWINFTVLVEKECQYVISLTNSLYPLLMGSRYYELEVEEGVVTVLYRC